MGSAPVAPMWSAVGAAKRRGSVGWVVSRGHCLGFELRIRPQSDVERIKRAVPLQIASADIDQAPIRRGRRFRNQGLIARHLSKRATERAQHASAIKLDHDRRDGALQEDACDISRSGESNSARGRNASGGGRAVP